MRDIISPGKQGITENTATTSNSAITIPARLFGVDLSPDMLGVARRRLGHAVTLRDRAYNAPPGNCLGGHDGFDLILASYTLSMFNPGWQQAIDGLCADLRPGGCLALVDFHDTPLHWFRSWMHMNHVRMDGHLLELLTSRLITRDLDIRRPLAL